MSLRILALVTPALLGSVPTVDAAVHGAVVFTRTGERTPLLRSSGPAKLTPWGAQQAHDQGNFFRQVYVMGQKPEDDSTPNARPIIDLSKDALKNQELYVLTPENDYATATAQAFIQGLYPPLGMNESSAALLGGEATLANGSFVQAPLGGYQYPQLRTASNYDPNLIYVAGAYGCLNAARDRNDYFSSPESSETKNRTGELYNNVGNAVLLGAISEDSWNYDRAYLIYDYVNYQYWHDASVLEAFTNNETLRGTLDQLRYLAYQQQWAMVNSTDNAHFIRSIAGQSLASKILNQLYININTAGSAAKMSLLFGEFDPMLAFIGLTGLSEPYPELRGIPDWASSFVVELFSDDAPGQPSNTSAATSNSTDGTGFSATYPNMDQLFVRFYLRNGSDTFIPLNQYGIFQNPPPARADDMRIPFQDFENALSSLSLGSASSLSSSSSSENGDDNADNNAPSSLLADPAIPAWCAVCEARSIFCSALNADLKGPKGAGKKGKGKDDDDESGSALSPAGAGVLGAGLVIVFAIIAALIAGTCGRMRVSRDPPPASNPKLPYLTGYGPNNPKPGNSGGVAAKAASASAMVFPCLPSSKRHRRNRRNASVGGFKGSDKLSSDLDVSFACNGAPPGTHASITAVPPGFVPPPPPSPPPKAAARMSSILGLNGAENGNGGTFVGVGGTGTVSGTPISDAYARSAKDDTFAGLGSGVAGEPMAHARSGSWELKEKNKAADATNATATRGHHAPQSSTSSSRPDTANGDDARSNLSGSTNVSSLHNAGGAGANRRSTIAKVGEAVGGTATVQSPFAIGDGEDEGGVDSRRSSGEVFEDAVAVEVVHRV
ncbi:histidine phosphatase superfamily [Phyllosticta capitalensis]